MSRIAIRKRALTAVSLITVAVVALSGCTVGQSGNKPATSDTITIGTTDSVIVFDPAGSSDNGAHIIVNNVFPFLMNSSPGSPDLHPDIAESAEFTSPTEYTVTLKSGIKWANGNDLTASDVKFSFDRQLTIAAENGPSSLLDNLDSIEVVDDLTVIFTLKKGDDQLWPQILSSPAGAIVDEEVFSADSLTPAEEIVAGNAFAGPYLVSTYKPNDLVQFTAFEGYRGLLESPKTRTINLKYYADQSNMTFDIQDGNIDLATRGLSTSSINTLVSDKDLVLHKGPGGEIRYIVFNLKTMPFGSGTPESSPGKAFAIREAIAHLIDREAIANQVYEGFSLPLYSFVPTVSSGAFDVLKSLYGDGRGGPDPSKAESVLKDAKVPTPVALSINYNTDHFGVNSENEFSLIKSQLEKSGLFAVTLESSSWDQYSNDRLADEYPLYQFSSFPEYADADTYLSPLFGAGRLLGNHFSNSEIRSLIKERAFEPDSVEREDLVARIQTKLAAQLPTLPVIQGGQIVIADKRVKGIDSTLDASFKFRFNVLSY